MAEPEDGDADDEEERRREKKHKKKKKKKKYYDEEKEEESKNQSKSKKEVSLVKEDEEDIVTRVKHSSFNPDIVAKKWDEKPDMKSIGRFVILLFVIFEGWQFSNQYLVMNGNQLFISQEQHVGREQKQQPVG